MATLKFNSPAIVAQTTATASFTLSGLDPAATTVMYRVRCYKASSGSGTTWATSSASSKGVNPTWTTTVSFSNLSSGTFYEGYGIIQWSTNGTTWTDAAGTTVYFSFTTTTATAQLKVHCSGLAITVGGTRITDGGTGTFTVTAGSNVTISKDATLSSNYTYPITYPTTSGSTITLYNSSGTPSSVAANWYFTVPAGGREVTISATPKSYTITTKTDPTAGGTISSGGTWTYGSTHTLTAIANSGYKISFWDRNGTRIAGSDSSISITVTANATYTVHFTQQFKLTFDSQGGSSVSTKYGFEGDTTTMPTCTKSNSSQYTYAYASYTVSYNVHGGSSCSSDSATDYHYAYDSYSLAYWAVDSTHYRSGATYTFPAADKTAIASWSTTVHDQGHASTSRIMLPTTTRTGYTFKGWYTTSSGGTRIGGAGDAYYPTSTITLHAQWEQITYSIKIQTDSSTKGKVKFYGDSSWTTTSTTKSINYGSSVTIMAEAQTGYSFVNWTCSDGTSSTDTNWYITPYDNKTYTANFKRVTKFFWLGSDSEDASKIAKGQPVTNLTATAWNNFNKFIHDNLDSSYTYTTVSSSTEFTAALFNEPRNWLYNHNYRTYLPAAVNSGDIVYATLFENTAGNSSLKNCVNNYI